PRRPPPGTCVVCPVGEVGSRSVDVGGMHGVLPHRPGCCRPGNRESGCGGRRAPDLPSATRDELHDSGTLPYPAGLIVWVATIVTVQKQLVDDDTIGEIFLH